MTSPVTGVSKNNTPAGVTGTNTANGNGVDGIASSQGGEGVHGESNSGFAAVAGYNKNTSAPGGPGVWGEGSPQGGDGVHGISHNAGGAGVAGFNTAGGNAGYFGGNIQVTGTLNVGVDIVLAATAGDFAEEFDLTGGADVEPGTVMVLDGEGAVQPSCRAYDRKVAGIVSGAGEYRPGIVLDKRDSTHPRKALALVGKVYCKVDANHSPIEIGDMLTTSPTSGHAMKATDAAQSFGAVIGKALRSISEGEGLIPVLVTLQ
jgi:hypothetical protein